MAMGAYLYSTIGSVGVEIISWFLILDGLFTIFLSAMVLVVDSVESELFDQED